MKSANEEIRLGVATETPDSEPASKRWPLPRFPLPEGRLSRLLFEVILILSAYAAYQLVRGVVDGRVDVAFTNAASLINLERSMGIFWEVQLQGLILGNRFLIDFFNWIYIWGHLPVIGILALWIFFFRRESFARYRNAFLISGAIGLVFFVTIPVAPPRFLTSAGFVDTITDYAQIYQTLQYPAFVNEYAAMPSLHFGWNLLVGLAVYQSTRVWYAKAFGLLMPLMMFVAVILTANHYILDPIIGGIVALVSLGIASMLHRQLAGTRVHAVLV